MSDQWTAFISTFATLLAIINPFEALPVFLLLLEGKDAAERRRIAARSCVYATLLMFFFTDLRDADPAAVRRAAEHGADRRRHHPDQDRLRAVLALAERGLAGSRPRQQERQYRLRVLLALPIMCGPGTIATVLGMQSQIRQAGDEIGTFAAIAGAILAAMLVTYLCLAYAGKLVDRLGPMGIDATTSIVGFFVSAMGVGLVFAGVVEGLREHGLIGPT